MKRLLILLFAASSLTAVGQVPDYVPTDGLTGWYALDNSAIDNGPLQNHGTIHGASGVVDRHGNANGALRFDVDAWSWGSGGHWVYIPFQESMNTPQVSVACWVRRNSGGLSWNGQSQVIAHRFQYGYNNPNGETWVLGMGNTVSPNGCVAYGGVIQQSPSPAISLVTETPGETSLQTWFHMVMTWDGEQLLMYENGEIVATASDPTMVMNQVGNSGISLGMSVQANGHWGPLDGDLDEFGTWSRALTSMEVIALFNESEPVLGCTDPSSCNFDENATADNGTCIPSGCMDAEACNYAAEAGCDDGSCDYTCCPGPGCCSVGHYWDWEVGKCFDINPGDINLDGCVQLNDLLDLLSAYGDCGAEETPWQCGDPLEYQGYNYETVQIGDQCWFAENLRAENYRNGESIVYSGAASDWETNGYTGLGSRAAYNDDALLGALWGYIYNGFAVNDERALCPTGWIVPKNADWLELGEFLGGMSVAGHKMKNSPNDEFGWNGDNSSGFGGYATGDRHWPDGSFNHALDGSVGDNEQVIGLYWSGAPGSIPAQNYYALYEMDDELTQSSSNGPPLGFGAAVRCIKDAE